MIACVPLHDAHFRADSRCVHQVLMNYLVVGMAEQWIKNLEPHADGRRDILALREHYSGEGNASRCIATVEQMREGLHYKNKRSLVFVSFLIECRRCSTFTKKKGRSLLKMPCCVNSSSGSNTLSSKTSSKLLKVRIDMEGITYTQAANHLTATVSELPEYHLTHKVSGSSSGAPRIRGGGGSGHNSNVKRKGGMQAPNKGILMSDRSGFTGYYLNWSELSKEDKQRVLDSRNKKKKGGVGSKQQISDVASIAEQLKVMKRTISELVSSKNNLINSKSSDDKAKTKVQHLQNDAGNAFGGRRAKSSHE